mmetsp:Transcript_11203/g.26711  ORF Transcript_11203/g.26711 Transcript_11203/m.26711 type:complete len:218 (-) Transcript_11203:1121-1774(-)
MIQRSPALAVLQLGVRSVVKQASRDTIRLRRNSHHQRRLPLRITDIRIRSTGKQDVGYLLQSATSSVQHCAACLVHVVRITLGLEQCLNHLQDFPNPHMRGVHTERQHRPGLSIHGARVSFRFQQHGHNADVLLACRNHQGGHPIRPPRFEVRPTIHQGLHLKSVPLLRGLQQPGFELSQKLLGGHVMPGLGEVRCSEGLPRSIPVASNAGQRPVVQ